MVVLRSLRQSSTYLYLKAYWLCALVSLFKATPVSSGIEHARNQLHLDKIQEFASCNAQIAFVREALAAKKRRLERTMKSTPTPEPGKRRSVTLNSSSPVRTTVERWYHRTADLTQVKHLLRRDDSDYKVYPELKWDASVRCSPDLHQEEKAFIDLRKRRISSQGEDSLHKFLGLPPDELVDPRDVPLVSLGGSGGGYRAMYGFGAFILASKKLYLWDCITWVAGVSGSCWTLGAYYTIAGHDIGKLMRHYVTVAHELAHPMSLYALNVVARSSKGIYFLIGPLLRKVECSIIGLGIMDLYATLITTYQFLSRQPGMRLSRATFQFSKVWGRSCAKTAAEPMPILTAVRRAPKDAEGVKPHRDSSISKGQPPDRSLLQHDADCLNARLVREQERPRDELGNIIRHDGLFQWFEISPLEIGCVDIQKYIPTWSWGRTFVSGHSSDRRPEQSFALLLGQCTSAPAGPLTGYISALLASLPKGTMMSRALFAINRFIRQKKWERLWVNPIRAGHDPNPFYGLNFPLNHNRDALEVEGAWDSVEGESTASGKSTTPQGELTKTQQWEAQGRVRLMDSGMSNNLPNHVLARAERSADVMISFDASSDVQTHSALQRIHNFAEDSGIHLEDCTDLFELPSSRSEEGAFGLAAAHIELHHLQQYAQVFRGRRHDGQVLYIVYCPLLPNPVNPHYNPSKAAFSSSYNLVWTPEQVSTLVLTAESNLSDYAITVIQQVMRKVYMDKKAQRLEFSQASQHDIGYASYEGSGHERYSAAG
ncbi:unnamed protein product [Clonostachys rhizophaga]|uniref:Lysophospholipase n=1 Tax=Clonostachys rhizophaga TaxID=160324 RepID=A0A9N9VES4_9HYPO|nr:unnamed protein product [Clonostachys rhizophaga]